MGPTLITSVRLVEDIGKVFFLFSIDDYKRTNQHGVNYNFDHDHDLIINSDYITYQIIVKKKSNGVHYVLFPLNFFYKKQLYIISRFIYL